MLQQQKKSLLLSANFVTQTNEMRAVLTLQSSDAQKTLPAYALTQTGSRKLMGEKLKSQLTRTLKWCTLNEIVFKG